MKIEEVKAGDKVRRLGDGLIVYTIEHLFCTPYNTWVAVFEEGGSSEVEDLLPLKQTQAALNEQLDRLQKVAVSEDLYYAHDWIVQRRSR